VEYAGDFSSTLKVAYFILINSFPDLRSEEREVIVNRNEKKTKKKMIFFTGTSWIIIKTHKNLVN